MAFDMVSGLLLTPRIPSYNLRVWYRGILGCLTLTTIPLLSCVGSEISS
jgi:hypothetical protein